MASETRVFQRAPPIPKAREHVLPSDVSRLPIHDITITALQPVGPEHLSCGLKYLSVQRAKHEVLRNYLGAIVHESLIPYQLQWHQRHWGAELTVRIEGGRNERGPPTRALTELLLTINPLIFHLHYFRGVELPLTAGDVERFVYEPHGPWHAVSSSTAAQTALAGYTTADHEYRGAHLNQAIRRLPYAPGTAIEVSYEIRRDAGRELLRRDPQQP